MRVRYFHVIWKIDEEIRSHASKMRVRYFHVIWKIDEEIGSHAKLRGAARRGISLSTKKKKQINKLRGEYPPSVRGLKETAHFRKICIF